VQQRKMKVREVIRMLEQDGWYLDRTRGSHRQYKHPKKPGLVTVVNLETILGQELLTAF
jgi:predicted RNA binding protein YcfA (HicA-like mRNA interferase family)